jgi:hypothetical protein
MMYKYWLAKSSSIARFPWSTLKSPDVRVASSEIASKGFENSLGELLVYRFMFQSLRKIFVIIVYNHGAFLMRCPEVAVKFVFAAWCATS